MNQKVEIPKTGPKDGRIAPDADADAEALRFAQAPERALPKMFGDLGGRALDVLESWPMVPRDVVTRMRTDFEKLRAMKDIPGKINRYALKFLDLGTIATKLFNQRFPDVKIDGNHKITNPAHEKFVRENPAIAKLWDLSGIAHQLYLSVGENAEGEDALRAHHLYRGALEEVSEYLAQARQRRPDEAMVAQGTS